jgi:hypothetical protein
MVKDNNNNKRKNNNNNNNDGKKVNKSLSDVLKNKKIGNRSPLDKGKHKTNNKSYNKNNNNNNHDNNNDVKKRKFKTVHGKRVDDKPHTFKSLKERKPNYGLVESMKDKVL